MFIALQMQLLQLHSVTAALHRAAYASAAFAALVHLQCPCSMVIPTMKNGIEMTMMFGNLFQTVGNELEARGGSGSAARLSKFEPNIGEGWFLHVTRCS
jgi:hypothetical protein